MSHVVTIDIHITDLAALKEAAAECGLVFREGQKTYRWYGTHVGDYPLPAGFSKEDLGRCDHALSVPDKPGAYEVGVVRRRDGKDGYTLIWDFWRGGCGLQSRVGKDCAILKGEYSRAKTKMWAKKNRYKVKEKKIKAGQYELKLEAKA